MCGKEVMMLKIFGDHCMKFGLQADTSPGICAQGIKHKINKGTKKNFENMNDVSLLFVPIESVVSCVLS
jgi:hypothetical protein